METVHLGKNESAFVGDTVDDEAVSDGGGQITAADTLSEDQGEEAVRPFLFDMTGMTFKLSHKIIIPSILTRQRWET